MDKDTTKLINEMVTKFFNENSKLTLKGEKIHTFDVCPHCKEEIYEKHEYTEDGGKTWRHSDCGGKIERPETALEEVADWLRPWVEKAREQISESATIESATIDGNLPVGGVEKYSKQEKGGIMSAVNLESSQPINKTESEEVQVVQPLDSNKMFDGQIRFINVSNIPLSFKVTKINVDTADAFLIRASNV